MQVPRDERQSDEAGSMDGFYLKATRWRSFLSRSCLTYHTLEEERAFGWNSRELSLWYASHHKEGTATRDEKNKKSIESEATTPAATTTSAAAASSFAAADVASLADAYRKHFQRVLVQAAPSFFTAGRGTFLDLGCAPGGVCRFLLEDLHWAGVGLTLPPTAQGIDVDAALLKWETQEEASKGNESNNRNEGDNGEKNERGGRGHAGRFVLLAGDVRQPPATWRRWDAVDRAAIGEAPVGARRFTFVNGGAVQDYGQRRSERGQGTPPAVEGVSLESPFASDGMKKTKGGRTGSAGKRPRDGEPLVHSEANAPQDPAVAAVEDVEVGSVCQAVGKTPETILPWFTLFVPQLRVALDHVERDGSGGIMLVYGAPQCASFFILLYALEHILLHPVCFLQDNGSHLLPSSPPDNMKVIETMHPGKSPVYILFTKVQLKGKESAIQQLMASIDPTSPTLYPMNHLQVNVPVRGGMVKSEVDAGKPLPEDPILRLKAKRDFWLGESDTGFAIARVAFQRYVPLISVVWQKNMQFLRRKRIRAEQQVAKLLREAQ